MARIPMFQGIWLASRALTMANVSSWCLTSASRLSEAVAGRRTALLRRTPSMSCRMWITMLSMLTGLKVIRCEMASYN
eukprot:9535509-Lingulodinium_polyedra.AAC.1